MATTKADIIRWIDAAKAEGAHHMLVVCDTFDYEDYLVEVKGDQRAIDVARERFGYPGSRQLQKVVECYDLNGDIVAQVNEHRALHFD